LEWTISIKGFLISLPPNLHPNDYDFDHPKSLDFPFINKCLKELLEKKETESPVYCFKTHKRLPEKTKLICKEVLIFEGILSLYDENIRNLFDLKIFIQCDADIALARRIIRDINERGRDIDEVLTRYNRFVKEDFEKFVRPQVKYVDLIVPGGANNDSNLISCSQFNRS
jgi:uridine kinase